ncbi:MAG TPA: hypothetical protein VIM94_04010 [Salegentibacter sp.]|uniref:hypothetical protein n=1 Tax=Salegentibacter sp. TaxID=1903072 RepID=UPI002F92DE76
MALHRFEEQAGKKLRERQISPSAGSWEKLEASLGRDKKRNNFGFWWPLVAAVVVLAFLAGSLFIRTATESPAIVEEPIINGPENTPEIKDFKAPVEIASEESDTRPAQPETTGPSIQNKQQAPQNIKHKELVVASAEVKNLHFELENITVEPPVQEATIERTELEEAIAMVVSEQAEKDLTDAEVDDLLLEAASQLTSQQTFENNGSVNASALLADVETELDHSFRKKVFELLKEGYAEARYTFVNRNN